jgi:hypothetical protein
MFERQHAHNLAWHEVPEQLLSDGELLAWWKVTSHAGGTDMLRTSCASGSATCMDTAVFSATSVSKASRRGGITTAPLKVQRPHSSHSHSSRHAECIQNANRHTSNSKHIAQSATLHA